MRLSIGNREIRFELAEPSKKSKVDTSVIGGSGTTVFAGMIGDEYNPKLAGSQKYRVYDEMRKSDPQIKALLLFVILPILGAHWDFEPASDDPIDQEVAEACRHAFFKSIEFKSFLRQAIGLTLSFGFCPFELVWSAEVQTWGNKGRFLRPYRKIATRLPKTTYQWHVDEDGDLVAWEQTVYKHDGKGGGRFTNCTIPAEKLLLFTLDQEGDNYEGESILRAAYKPWFLKKTLEVIGPGAIERFGMGLLKFKQEEQGEVGTDDKNNLESLGENWASNERSYMILPFGWDAALESVTGKLPETLPLLNYYNLEISKAALQNFTQLGTTETGSRAVGDVQADPFHQSLNYIANGVLAEKINHQAVVPFVAHNFGPQVEPPKLTCSKIQAKNVQVISSALAQLAGATLVTPDFDTENFVREVLDMPPKKEDTRDEKPVEVGAKPKGEPPAEEDPKRAHECGCGKGHKKLAEGAEFWRDLRPEENFVALSEIKDTLNRTRDDLTQKLLSIRKDQIADLVDRGLKTYETGGIAALSDIKVGFTKQAAAAHKAASYKVFNFGKEQVRAEIERQGISQAKLKARAAGQKKFDEGGDDGFWDIEEVQKWLADLADLKARMAAEDIKKSFIANVVKWDKQRTIDIAKMRQAIREALEALSDAGPKAYAGESINASFQFGRAVEAQDVKDELESAVYSAILDENVCGPCEDQDGEEVSPDEAIANPTPNPECLGGDKCRCTYIYLVKQHEEDGE